MLLCNLDQLTSLGIVLYSVLDVIKIFSSIQAFYPFCLCYSPTAKEVKAGNEC